MIGFGDIDQAGYLDRLFVHADYQRRGVATAICHQLEQAVAGRVITHASITARPFFESRGYQVIREQQVARQGVLLTNFVMEKEQSSVD
ncbi:MULTISPECIES: GNAT family N-acetyltransferase [Latilactobacillus]|uniref:GNAT family N-acetyltransferase n=1 Tax=Latilactobacillus TaxID=2767885 RepID=UPI0025470F24|nr:MULTISPECIES: GNAT family N-acetyltransferase [Latilactobacillus]MCP8855721.1 GNAT family N-acetyltransferase [Latilactobacillus sakei]